MRNINLKLQERIAAEVTALVNCWKLTLQNGEIIGFTDHDQDIEFDNLLYQASSGFTSSALMSDNSLAADNVEIEAMLNSPLISEEEIIAGKYDFAEVELFKLDYLYPEYGKILMKRGWLGEITIHNGEFVAEIHSLSQKMNYNLGEIFSPYCRAEFGDHKCKINKEEYSYQCEIVKIYNNKHFMLMDLPEVNNFFNYGEITFISGYNKGISMEVKSSIKQEIVLNMAMPYKISLGDKVRITAGCDKKFISCCNYNNAINFRGEPHLPGINKLIYN